MQLITAIAAIAATAAIVNAQYANINNYCDFEVYVWPTDGTRNPSSGTPIPPGSNWCEAYQTAGGGVSLKISTSKSLGAITQFEYDVSNSLGPDLWEVWYDGSNINCFKNTCPFWNYNLYIEASNSDCPAGPCPAQTVCPGFYNDPNDNADSFSCKAPANTTMHLCIPDDLLPTSQNSVPIAPVQSSSLVKAEQVQPSSSVLSSVPSPPPSPATTAPPVQVNQAIVETTITVTTTTWVPNRFAARHAHAQRHGHA